MDRPRSCVLEVFPAKAPGLRLATETAGLRGRADGRKTTETYASFLHQVVIEKREELAQRQVDEPIDALKRRIGELDEQWSLMRAILEGSRGPSAGGKRVQLIAEIKKASPSKGRLVSVLEHRAMARTYTIGGAAGISVVTERNHFHGELQWLLDCRVSMMGYYPGGRPSMLRKDFMFDTYHLWEARAYGADAVLLIVAVLDDDSKLRDMIEQARELQMDPLVEVHDRVELERAVAAGADFIGINNRNLAMPGNVDITRTLEIAPIVPRDQVSVLVSESGFRTRDDVDRVANCGVNAVLVGEALITSNEVREKMRQFIL